MKYDDLLSLVGTECEKNALEVIKNQLMKDLEEKKANKPVSLLAKWMPSCNATSYKTKENATVVRKYLGFTERQYRKILSGLREYIDVVERKMSAKKWGEINYEAVPSKANLIYNNAFLKNDEERRREYLDKLENGEAKINSSTNFPHDIVHSYLKGRSYYRSNIKEDKALEALWKALPDTVQGDGNTLVVRDGSGSMMCSVDPNSSITALEVATALAIYLGYTSLSGSYWARGNSNSAFMALMDVAYGKPYDVHSFDSKYYDFNYERLQKTCPGANCLHAHAGSMLRNDEIIVYKEDQCTIKYLVELR